MSQDQSLAVIDATDATVLPPEQTPAALTPEQEKTLGTCEFQLHRLGRRIAARESDLIYLYVEFGYHLAKAQAVHLTECTTVGHSAGGQIVGSNPGFKNWLERPEVNVPRNSAYRYIQAAKSAGLTAESTPAEVKALKDAAKLAGQTLAALCRKPVDKTEKKAEIHEVSDEEQAKLDEEERNERWQAIAAQLHDYGIEADEWAKLDLDRRAGLYDVLTELAKRIKPSLRKGKPAPATPALPDKAPAPAIAPAADSHLFKWRVGQRTGQNRWQIKKAPNWGVVHEVDSPEQAATWLSGHGVDLATVAALTTAPWPTLVAHLEALAGAPLEADVLYTQEDADRGLWWYGYRNPYGSIIVHTYKGDMEPVLEARRHPACVVVGPFFATGQDAAETRVRTGIEGMKSAAEMVTEEQQNA